MTKCPRITSVILMMVVLMTALMCVAVEAPQTHVYGSPPQEIAVDTHAYPMASAPIMSFYECGQNGGAICESYGPLFHQDMMLKQENILSNVGGQKAKHRRGVTKVHVDPGRKASATTEFNLRT